MEKIHPMTRRLPNGLLAHFYRRPSEVIGLGVAVSVGGWHDPVGKEGLAHLLEHVLFCGSRQWSENRIQVELERWAALRNGLTSDEYTFYWIVLPADGLEFGLKYLRQLVF